MNFNRTPGHMGMEVPKHTQETLEGYLLRGWEPGGFVTSMLALDMERALSTADTGNRQMMWVIGQWIIQNAPEECQGSYATVKAWCADPDMRRPFVELHEKKKVWNTLNNGVEHDEPLF